MHSAFRWLRYPKIKHVNGHTFTRMSFYRDSEGNEAEWLGPQLPGLRGSKELRCNALGSVNGVGSDFPIFVGKPHEYGGNCSPSRNSEPKKAPVDGDLGRRRRGFERIGEC